MARQVSNCTAWICLWAKLILFSVGRKELDGFYREFTRLTVPTGSTWSCPWGSTTSTWLDAPAFLPGKGCTFPEHLLDPEMGKTEPWAAFRCCHGQDPPGAPLSCSSWNAGGTGRSSTAVQSTEMSTAPFWDKHIPACKRCL